jgi:predicted MFS family arabinose efflux permease
MTIGVISVILLMPPFLLKFPRVSASASGAGFWKGLMTAMIELGALLGTTYQGCIADEMQRKYSMIAAVVIFLVHRVLQAAAHGYAMRVVAN